MGFSRQEYWSGLPFLSPGDLPDPGIEPRSPALEAGAWIAVVSSNSIGSVLTESGYAQLLSHVWLSAPSRTVIRQAPLSMGFSRQECWSGLPFPSPGDLLDPEIEPKSPTLQADALPWEPMSDNIQP